MKITTEHSNRKLYNWLVYDIGDKFLMKYSKYFKGKLADLGCGESPYKDFFLCYADSYIGVDWTNTLHNSKADIISDLNVSINLDAGSVDSIVSLSVMEHLREPQIFLNESNRILKSGGAMVLQVPWQWWIHESPYDYFRYTPYGLKYMFEKAGFTDVNIEAQAGFFTMWLLKFNYFSVRLLRGPRPVKWLILGTLIPLWTLNQLVAPVLDKLDRNKTLETSGFYVVAVKN